MAGHSKWKNIQRRKTAMDAKRGKLFTRLAREIIIAAREGGGNPDANPRLRMAIERANGGSLGESGSVAWQFERMAYFSIPAQGHDPEAILDLAIEAGADDVEFDEDFIEIYGPVQAFKTISDALEQAGIKPDEAGLKMVPKQKLTLPPEQAAQVLRLIEVLQDLDDVQEVYSNLDITEEAVAQFEAA